MEANGQPLEANNEENPLRVKEHTGIEYSGHSYAPADRISFVLRYFGIPFAHRRDPVNNTTTLSGSFPVDRYATYGVGSYWLTVTIERLPSTMESQVCSGQFWVVVEGNPLKTPAGEAAAGVGVLGVGALAGAFGAGGKKVRVPEGMQDWVLQEPGDASDLEQKSREARAKEDERLSEPTTQEGADRKRLAGAIVEAVAYKVCAALILPAILMTLLAAATASSFPRARWKLRLSFIGIIGGLLTALSATVLLQQYGLLFPTRGVGIFGLVAGILLGIAIPSLGKKRLVNKANRRISELERGS